MKLAQCLELTDDILAPYSAHAAIQGYKNHVCRVINLCSSLGDLNECDLEKITIAACFHDLGIYTSNTFDYLPPSIDLAREYLVRNGRGEWTDEITSTIDQHHRVRPIDGVDRRLAEVFRKADLVDFSLGLIKFDLPRSTVSAVKREFPNRGFHRNLVRVACGWIARHPLRPVPVLKW